MIQRITLLAAVAGCLLPGLAGTPVHAQAIGWNDFSGGEHRIDFSGWNYVPLPDPFYYQGCTFYEQGSDLNQNGWSPLDWTFCFQDGSTEFPGLSLGYGMADNREASVIKIELTDFANISRVGILASGGTGTTYRLEAFDVSGYSLGNVEATIPADCHPVWLGIETAFEISVIMITEPSGGNIWRGMFDDLRFEDSANIFFDGFESNDVSAWSASVP